MTFGFSSAEVRVSSTESISSLAKAISSARMDEEKGVGVEVVVVVREAFKNVLADFVR